MTALEGAPQLVDRVERITAASLAEQLAGPEPPLILDVRSDGEWRLGHIEHALHVPLSRLEGRIGALPRDRSVGVHCATDYRSAIAVSLPPHARPEDGTGLGRGLTAWG